MFQTEVAEKIKIHILCSMISPLSKIHAFFEIIWKIL